MSNAASVKARLRNRSIETGKTMQEMLTAYALERTIYRLSISKYNEIFTLKGGIFLHALFDGDYARITTDIDFLAQKLSNDIDEIKEVFTEIFSIETDDPLRYDFDTIKVVPITEFKKYHGVNVSVKSYLDRTMVLVSMDIGYGDVIYPDRVEMDFPVILGDASPRIFAYSLTSSIAEKFEAIVSLAYDNSRFKDYYDIYVIALKYDFDGAVLKEALKETFDNRHTSLDEIVAFEDGFVSDSLRQSRWNAFVKKKKPLIKVSLEETIEKIKLFLFPIVKAIREDKSFETRWNCQEQKWDWKVDVE